MKTVKIIDMKDKMEKGKKFKRQVDVVGSIVKHSIKEQLSTQATYAFSAGIGVAQGLKLEGDFKHGVKSGLASIAIMTGTNIVMNLVDNIETIRNA